MKSKFLIYTIINFSLVLTSCSLDINIDSDEIITKKRKLSIFNEVDVENDIEVIIKQGPEQSVKVTTRDDFQKKVITTVSARKLTVRINGTLTKKLNILRLEITMPNITRLVLSSDSFGKLLGFENLDAFRLKLSNDSSISLLSGSSNSIDIDASSDAKIEGFDFETKTCHVKCTSDASIYITCSEVLSGSVSSDAVLFYKGNPTVNVSTSSDGSVINSN